MALSAAANEAIWQRRLMEELSINFNQKKPTTIFGDNTGSLYIGGNCIVNAKTKHIDIRLHNVWEHIKNGAIEVIKVMTEEMVADQFTKPLSGAHFLRMRERLMMIKICD